MALENELENVKQELHNVKNASLFKLSQNLTRKLAVQKIGKLAQIFTVNNLVYSFLFFPMVFIRKKFYRSRAGRESLTQEMEELR